MDTTNQGSRNPDDIDHGDIFAGLLGCSTSGNASNKSIHKSHQDSQCITVVDSAVLYQPGLITFLSTDDKILCFTATDCSCVLSEFCRTSSDDGDPDQISYSALPAFKTTLEMSLLITPTNGSECCYNYSPCKLQLCFVQPSNVCNVPCFSSVTICRSFFNKLFGSEASLLDSPVILFGGEDGQICFFPINGFTSSGTSSCCQALRDGGASPLPLRLLYHLEQEVSAILVAKVNCQDHQSPNRYPYPANDNERSDPLSDKSNSYDSNAVVLVGKLNKIVIVSESTFKSCKGSSNAVEFAEHTILGPVMCCCLNSNGDTLLHSTGKEIFITKLSIFHDGEDNKSAPVTLNSISLPIPNICAVCCEPGKKSRATEVKKQDKIIALTIGGKLISFCLPGVENGISCGASNISSQVAGQKVKDFLCEIESQSESLAKVNTTIEIEDKILKELNIIINIACELIGNMRELSGTKFKKERTQDISSVSCIFTPNVICHDSIRNCTVNLHCRVANQGHLPLSSCWSLMVQIEGKQAWLQKDGGEPYTIGRSVPIQSLDGGSAFTLDIPLSKCLSSSFYIVAEAHLYCNLNHLLSHLKGKTVLGFFLHEEVQNIVIPIQRQVFDVLDFMQPYVVGPHVSVQGQAYGSLHELVKTLGNMQSELHLTSNTRRNTEQSVSGMHSAVFQISGDTVSVMKDYIESSIGFDFTSATTELTVLYFIVIKSGVSLQLINKDSLSVNLITINGDHVAIHVRSVTPHTNAQNTSELFGAEVTLQCASISLLCRLHEAVLSRLKVKLLTGASYM